MTDYGRDGYRCGVGIVLLNDQGLAFVGRRIGLANVWQMPQGGIALGETPRDAACRELMEEIGTNHVEFLAESENWFRYEVPAHLRPKRWGDRWQGQTQKWLVASFRGQDSEIDLKAEEPEFDAWRWVAVGGIPDLAPSFKRALYTSVLGAFAHIFRD